MKDVYYRLEDALAATKSALNNGYVIGGGMAYYNAAIAVKEKHGKENPSYIEGWNAMINAAKKPVEWIVKNATGNGVLVDIGGNIGFDAISCKSADLFELGIIDPFQVVKSCINNASSVSSMLITTNVIITNKIRKK